MSFEPSPDTNCSRCSGHGFTVSPKRDYAFATMCGCVSKCTRCESGVVRVEVDGVWRSGRCRCQKLPDRIEMFNRSGITARHGNKDMSNFQFVDPGNFRIQTSTDMWLQGFATKSQDRGVIFHGDVGRGKTHLMVGLCKRLIFEYGVAVRFIEFSRLLGQLRDGYSSGKSDELILGELVDVPVLAIDEIGKGRLTEWEISIIDDIISRRYNSLRPILGTTNYQWKGPSGNPVPALASHEFKQTLGDRIGARAFSRLQEISIPLTVSGSDYRTLQQDDVSTLSKHAASSNHYSASSESTFKAPQPKRFNRYGRDS